MAIADTKLSQAPMVDSRFKTAAYLCFFYPILILFGIAFRIIVAVQQSATLNFIIDIPITIVTLVISIYILLQLRRLLVERHHLHIMSNLINFIIIIHIYLNVVGFFLSIFQMIVQNPNAGVLFFLILLIPGVLLFWIITIILGIKLLAVKELPSGLYRTYAILSIISGACIFTIILIPIAILSGIASSVVLGMIFLEESKNETQVEFV